MNNSNNIITQALSYYDKKKHQFKSLYNTKKYTFTIIKEDTAEGLPVCLFTRLSSKDKEIKANYNFLGILHKSDNLWVWGWSVIGYNLYSRIRSIIYLTKQIMNYAFDLQTNVESQLFYKVQDTNSHQRSQVLYIQILKDLLTSQFYVRHPLHLEKILALSLYITNSDMIYVENIENLNIQAYYIIQNIDKSSFQKYRDA